MKITKLKLDACVNTQANTNKEMHRILWHRQIHNLRFKKMLNTNPETSRCGRYLISKIDTVRLAKI